MSCWLSLELDYQNITAWMSLNGYWLEHVSVVVLKKKRQMRQHTRSTLLIGQESPGAGNKNGPCDVCVRVRACTRVVVINEQYAVFYAIQVLILHLRSGCWLELRGYSAIIYYLQARTPHLSRPALAAGSITLLCSRVHCFPKITFSVGSR